MWIGRRLYEIHTYLDWSYENLDVLNSKTVKIEAWLTMELKCF